MWIHIWASSFSPHGRIATGFNVQQFNNAYKIAYFTEQKLL